MKLHQGKIRAFLVRLCKNFDRTDDLAQETFLLAYRKLNDYTGIGSFSSWLFKIAYNCFLQDQRARNRRLEVMDNYQQQFELAEDRYDSISPAQVDLERAMTHLNSGEIASISLCYGYGLSHTEASDILQIPLGTVKTNILRGKDKLRELLAYDSINSTPRREKEE